MITWNELAKIFINRSSSLKEDDVNEDIISKFPYFADNDEKSFQFYGEKKPKIIKDENRDKFAEAIVYGFCGDHFQRLPGVCAIHVPLFRRANLKSNWNVLGHIMTCSSPNRRSVEVAINKFLEDVNFPLSFKENNVDIVLEKSQIPKSLIRKISFYYKSPQITQWWLQIIESFFEELFFEYDE